MPELAELKLTAEYVNKMAEGKVFHGVAKNPEHKGEEITINFPFVIEAQSRGKELMLTISTAPDFVTDQVEVKHLMMGMGMSGHFKWVKPGSVEKHAHLVFKTDTGTLAFVDVRRFGKWKWGCKKVSKRFVNTKNRYYLYVMEIKNMKEFIKDALVGTAILFFGTIALAMLVISIYALFGK